MFVISTLREKLALTKILFQLRQHLTLYQTSSCWVLFAECLFAHLFRARGHSLLFITCFTSLAKFASMWQTKPRFLDY